MVNPLKTFIFTTLRFAPPYYQSGAFCRSGFRRSRQILPLFHNGVGFQPAAESIHGFHADCPTDDLEGL